MLSSLPSFACVSNIVCKVVSNMVEGSGFLAP
jgi:hypothetical protein